MTDEPGRAPALPPGPDAAGSPAPDPGTAAGPPTELGVAEEPHPWAEPDRPRGLDAYFPPGGEDDAAPERIADERRLTRLLVLMLVLLVAVPLLLTAIGFVIELTALRGG